MYKTPPSKTKNQKRMVVSRERGGEAATSSHLCFVLPEEGGHSPIGLAPARRKKSHKHPQQPALSIRPPDISPQTSILPVSSDRAPNKLRLREKLPPSLTLV